MTIECAGAPRDVGFDQGRACAAQLRLEFDRHSRWERLRLRAGQGDPHTVRVALDLLRHFPHQAEALEGLARGARVPRVWLASRLAHELGGASLPEASEAVGAAVRGSQSAEGSLLARSVATESFARRVRPDGGFGSVELTTSWLTSALAGVNERGLALVCVPGSSESVGCAAPAVLLIRDCLQQFDSLEAGIAWCTDRPVGGRATLLLADSHGEMAAVELDGDARRVRRPANGLWVAVSGSATREAGDRLEKSLAEPVTAQGLARATVQAAESDGVVVDPRRRRLGYARGTEVAWVSV